MKKIFLIAVCLLLENVGIITSAYASDEITCDMMCIAEKGERIKYMEQERELMKEKAELMREQAEYYRKCNEDPELCR